ncbi:hypothetical protein [Microbulbifer aggregans]|nr:hypothetical protein [Microbulbifer aggregans]
MVSTKHKLALWAVSCLTAGAVVAVLGLTRGEPAGSDDLIPLPPQVAGKLDPAPEAIADDTQPLQDQAVEALLEHPRVQEYLAEETDKRALQDYFAGGDGEISDDEAWALIERIEHEGRVLAFEALTLKLAWLDRNSDNKDDYDQRSAEILAQYRQRSERQLQQYDPYEEVPGFARYKELEAEIVREVQQMESFPEGVSRQAYLRQRLQAARQEAYGH